MFASVLSVCLISIVFSDVFASVSDACFKLFKEINQNIVSSMIKRDI
jgi:hypothetical protein